jgi:hypothetical protein
MTDLVRRQISRVPAVAEELDRRAGGDGRIESTNCATALQSRRVRFPLVGRGLVRDRVRIPDEAETPLASTASGVQRPGAPGELCEAGASLFQPSSSHTTRGAE